MSLIKMIRLLWMLIKMGLKAESTYRLNFFFQGFQSLLNLGLALGGQTLIFAHTTTLAGWRRDEVLALLGIYMLLDGLMSLCVKPGFQTFVNHVQTGRFDFTLLQPIDAQFFISMQRVQIWQIVNVLLGGCTLVIAFIHLFWLGTALSFMAVGQGFCMLVISCILIYNFWLLLVTCCFWLQRVESILAIFQLLYETSRWPAAIYPIWLRSLLTFLVPVALVTTVPAEVFLRRSTWQMTWILIGGALLLALMARRFWLYGVRSYTGASA